MYLVKLQTGLTFTSKGICSLCTFYKENNKKNHSVILVTFSIASSIFCLVLFGCVLSSLLPPRATAVEGSWEGLGLVGSSSHSICPCLPERCKKGGLSLLIPPLHLLLGTERFWLDHEEAMPPSSLLGPFLPLLGASRVTGFYFTQPYGQLRVEVHFFDFP